MNNLFSYGTFRSAYVQKRLFGREVPAKPAELTGYGVYAGKDGYHGLLPCESAAVSGALLELTDRKLDIADGWEICPKLYYRREMELCVGGVPVPAWVYFRTDPDALSGRIEDGNLLFTLPQTQLDRELDEYIEELKQKGLL
ncbi:MAG: gamma-glutamylcyclotransferase [Intestinimonas sp.]|jgi:gamma-glutamylcyclotransferase (GGCT)/AIG2-like uncharacterized protein YtfP|nr:gamma-glutamylcyclotransferase [Intestinimonas sp.]